MDHIEFGHIYRDKITGFTGACIAKTQFISGCNQVHLQPAVDEKGNHREGQWVDDAVLVDAETGDAIEATSDRGGPQHIPMPR